MSGDDIWARLRRATPARLNLGRSGASLPTRALLEFGVAHAQARDAVHSEVDWAKLAADLRAATGYDSCRVDSAAADRATYLRRPDLGRQLAEPAEELLASLGPAGDRQMVVVFADGLSAAAIQKHAVLMLAAFKAHAAARLFETVVMARNARVALGDSIGELLKAHDVLVAIGERPGLSSPDSLGLYLTRAPRLGRSDAERNCLSNIHGQGMSYAVAAMKLAALLDGADRIGATGTRLKDETDARGMPILESAAVRAALPAS